MYTVYIRYVWQGFHQIYGHIRCIYTVLANPTNKSQCLVPQLLLNFRRQVKSSSTSIPSHLPSPNTYNAPSASLPNLKVAIQLFQFSLTRNCSHLQPSRAHLVLGGLGRLPPCFCFRHGDQSSFRINA